MNREVSIWELKYNYESLFKKFLDWIKSEALSADLIQEIRVHPSRFDKHEFIFIMMEVNEDCRGNINGEDCGATIGNKDFIDWACKAMNFERSNAKYILTKEDFLDIVGDKNLSDRTLSFEYSPNIALAVDTYDPDKHEWKKPSTSHEYVMTLLSQAQDDCMCDLHIKGGNTWPYQSVSVIRDAYGYLRVDSYRVKIGNNGKAVLDIYAYDYE